MPTVFSVSWLVFCSAFCCPGSDSARVGVTQRRSDGAGHTNRDMFQRFRNASLQSKQTIVIMVTCVVALVLACLAFVTFEIITFRKELVRDLGTLAEMIGNASS